MYAYFDLAARDLPATICIYSTYLYLFSKPNSNRTSSFEDIMPF